MISFILFSSCNNRIIKEDIKVEDKYLVDIISVEGHYIYIIKDSKSGNIIGSQY
jgi:hypothetical protein